MKIIKLLSFLILLLICITNVYSTNELEKFKPVEVVNDTLIILVEDYTKISTYSGVVTNKSAFYSKRESAFYYVQDNAVTGYTTDDIAVHSVGGKFAVLQPPYYLNHFGAIENQNSKDAFDKAISFLKATSTANTLNIKRDYTLSSLTSNSVDNACVNIENNSLVDSTLNNLKFIGVGSPTIKGINNIDGTLAFKMFRIRRIKGFTSSGINYRAQHKPTTIDIPNPTTNPINNANYNMRDAFQFVSDCSDVKFYNNTFSYFYQVSVILSGVDGFEFKNNQWYDQIRDPTNDSPPEVQPTGILANNNTKNGVIHECTFTNILGANKNNNCHGVYFGSTDNILVENNLFQITYDINPDEYQGGGLQVFGGDSFNIKSINNKFINVTNNLYDCLNGYSGYNVYINSLLKFDRWGISEHERLEISNPSWTTVGGMMRTISTTTPITIKSPKFMNLDPTNILNSMAYQDHNGGINITFTNAEFDGFHTGIQLRTTPNANSHTRKSIFKNIRFVNIPDSSTCVDIRTSLNTSFENFYFDADTTLSFAPFVTSNAAASTDVSDLTFKDSKTKDEVAAIATGSFQPYKVDLTPTVFQNKDQMINYNGLENEILILAGLNNPTEGIANYFVVKDNTPYGVEDGINVVKLSNDNFAILSSSLESEIVSPDILTIASKTSGNGGVLVKFNQSSSRKIFIGSDSEVSQAGVGGIFTANTSTKVRVGSNNNTGYLTLTAGSSSINLYGKSHSTNPSGLQYSPVEPGGNNIRPFGIRFQGGNARPSSTIATGGGDIIFDGGQGVTGGDNGNFLVGTVRSTKMGIGVTNPKAELEVNGGIKIANDTDTASVDKVGTIRYRSDANNSYVEMCMKTGASSYSWEIIVQKTW